MTNLDLSYNDRKFLRQLHIDPEASVTDDMSDVLSHPAQFNPPTVVISATVARSILELYGTISYDTLMQYIYGRRMDNSNGK